MDFSLVGVKEEPMDGEGTPSPDGRIEATLQTSSGGKERRRYHRKDAKKKKIEDPNAPRRPRSGYVHFLSHARAKYGSGKGTVNQVVKQREINEALAAEWRALSEPDRKEFMLRSEREKAEYERLMAVYIKTPEYKEWNATHAHLKKVKKEEWSEDEDRSSKHKKSGKKGSHHKRERDPSCQPAVAGIFSDQFVEYNRNQETLLRNTRRQIGQAEDELAALRRNSHSLDVNSDHLREFINKDRLEADRLEDTLSTWLDQVKTVLGDDEIEDAELEAYLEDLLDNQVDNREVIDRLSKTLSNTVFVVHQ